MNGPLSGRQLVIILIVVVAVVGTFFSIRANFQKADRIDNQTQCVLGSPGCR